METQFAPQLYLDLAQTEWPGLFNSGENAWEAVPKLAGVFELLDDRYPQNLGRIIGSPFIGEHVYIGKGTVIEPGAYIKGPAYIGENCQIRHGAYIRENVIIGGGSVIGNSCEIKNSILFRECQIPHFNYVGDSVLGHKTHLAAGVIISNLKLEGDIIHIHTEAGSISTGLRKFGALVGDHSEVGCNAVLNPGSILGRRSLVYPGVAWRGVLPANSIAKEVGRVELRRESVS